MVDEISRQFRSLVQYIAELYVYLDVMSEVEPTDRQERERVERWVAEHASAIRGFLYGLIVDMSMAEDLLQEVFCRAWQARKRYAENGKDRAYLLRIADRLVRDQRRKRLRERPVADWEAREPIDDRDPATQLQNDEIESKLRDALASLSDVQRRTLLLRYYGKLSFAEIAEIMECPVNTALSHCRRGLQTLKLMMVEAGE